MSCKLTFRELAALSMAALMAVTPMGVDAAVAASGGGARAATSSAARVASTSAARMATMNAARTESLNAARTASLNAAELANLRLARLGFVFQFHFLLPEFSTLDNVLIPIRRLGRLNDASARAQAMKLLEALGMAEAAAKLPEQLSGGMRQRAAIARALANDPALILADEPTGNLDTRNAAAVFDIFARLASEEGRAILVVTHDAELAKRANRRIHLVDGRIVSDSRAG